jgi:hypothetical protein
MALIKWLSNVLNSASHGDGAVAIRSHNTAAAGLLFIISMMSPGRNMVFKIFIGNLMFQPAPQKEIGVSYYSFSVACMFALNFYCYQMTYSTALPSHFVINRFQFLLPSSVPDLICSMAVFS